MWNLFRHMRHSHLWSSSLRSSSFKYSNILLHKQNCTQKNGNETWDDTKFTIVTFNSTSSVSIPLTFYLKKLTIAQRGSIILWYKIKTARKSSPSCTNQFHFVTWRVDSVNKITILWCKTNLASQTYICKARWASSIRFFWCIKLYDGTLII